MDHTYLEQYLINLKNKYVDEFQSFNHIRELIPISNYQDVFDKSLVEKLHTFFKYNKIYYKKRELKISNIPCISYEGDINHFWLGSKKMTQLINHFFQHEVSLSLS